MRILLLGGTSWLGGYVAAVALDRGHDVTCLARGESGSAPAGVAFVRSERDRPEAYDQVVASDWDVTIEVARQPGHVRRAVAALANRSRFFVFVSSGSVYADHSTPGQDERADLVAALKGDVMATMDTYGEAKVACEQYVLAGFGPDRCLIARVGLIGGPGDIFDRTGYWPMRFAQPTLSDGTVLVPDAPDLATQVIDVRDLAAWLVAGGCGGVTGIFNATGATHPLGPHLDTARSVAGHTGPVVAAGEDWLVAHDVQPWMGERSLPLWLPVPDYAGFSARDSSAARSAGLSTRPVKDTLRDALAWEIAAGIERPRRAGLSREDERALIHELSGVSSASGTGRGRP